MLEASNATEGDQCGYLEVTEKRYNAGWFSFSVGFFQRNDKSWEEQFSIQFERLCTWWCPHLDSLCKFSRLCFRVRIHQNSEKWHLQDVKQEGTACQHLLLKSDTTVSEVDEEERGALSLSEIFLMQKRRRQDHVQSYMNSRFIIESSTEVEMLFSLARGTLADNWQSITPLLFEYLYFLKVIVAIGIY